MSDRELYFRADDLKRLKSIIKKLDDREMHKQKMYGDRLKGGARSCDFKDATALRRVVEAIEHHRAAAEIGKAVQD